MLNASTPTPIDVHSIKVLPISLAVTRGALASSLYGYKDNDNAASRVLHADKVRSLLHDYVHTHGKCLSAAARVRQYDLITWVPSAQGVRVGVRHPMADMVVAAPWNYNRAAELLQRTTIVVDKHSVHRDRFTVIDPSVVVGKSILIVDDTWTTGSNAMSAAWSLRLAGAASVSVVVIGRWYNQDYRDSAIYSNHAQKVGFSSESCVYCDQRSGLEIERSIAGGGSVETSVVKPHSGPWSSVPRNLIITPRSVCNLGAGRDGALTTVPFVAIGLKILRTTLGLSRIIEVAAVRMNHRGEVLKEFTSHVNPGGDVALDPNVLKIGESTPQVVVMAPSIEEVLAEFSRFVGDCAVVAHGLRSLNGFLSAEYGRWDVPVPAWQGVCTKAESEKLGAVSSHQLSSLLELLNSGSDRPGVVDARACGLLMATLIGKCGLSDLEPVGRL